METVKMFLEDKKLCDNNFLLYMDKKIEFINPEMIDFSGCYVINGQIKIKVPQIINDYTRSVMIHELGHLYDYYKNGKFVENEDNALLWKLIYLEYSHNEELLLERIQKIQEDDTSLHYKSLQKIKRS